MEEIVQIALYYSVTKIDHEYLVLVGSESLDNEMSYTVLGIGVGYQELNTMRAALKSASDFTEIPKESLVLYPAPEDVKWHLEGVPFGDTDGEIYELI